MDCHGNFRNFFSQNRVKLQSPQATMSVLRPHQGTHSPCSAQLICKLLQLFPQTSLNLVKSTVKLGWIQVRLFPQCQPQVQLSCPQLQTWFWTVNNPSPFPTSMSVNSRHLNLLPLVSPLGSAQSCQVSPPVNSRYRSLTPTSMSTSNRPTNLFPLPYSVP